MSKDGTTYMEALLVNDTKIKLYIAVEKVTINEY